MVEHNLAKVGVASSNLVSRLLEYGWVAEWLCSGLQSRGRRFDSGLSLVDSPGGGIGRRKGLKIPRKVTFVPVRFRPRANLIMINSLSFYIAYRYLKSSRFNRFARLIQTLSVLGITIGVSILIVISSIFNGFHAEIQQSLKSINPHIIITHENFWWSDWKDTYALLEKNGNIANVSPKIRTYAMIAAGGNRQPVQLVATQPTKDSSHLNTKKVTKKIRNNPVEILDAKITKELQNELWLEPGDTFGLLTAKSMDFEDNQPLALRLKVKRIDHHKPSILSKRTIETNIQGLTEQLNIEKNSITELQIDTTDIMTVQKTIADLETQLPNELRITNISEQFTSLLSALAMQRKMMIIVLSLVVIIAAFNLTASLVMIVMERKGEIALLQTIGVNKKRILLIFVYQSLLLAGIGLLAGCMLGIMIANNITDIIATLENTMGIQLVSDQVFMLDHLPSVVDIRDITAIGITTMSLSILSALYPAHMASKVDPAETLRYE